MRTCVVLVSIALILALLCITECVIVRKFCFDMDKSVSSVMEKLESGICENNDVDKIEKTWSDYKSKVFIFLNHNMFKDYEDSISDMQYHCALKDNESLYFNSYKMSELNKRMKDSMQFDLGNIF